MKPAPVQEFRLKPMVGAVRMALLQMEYELREIRMRRDAAFKRAWDKTETKGEKCAMPC